MRDEIILRAPLPADHLEIAALIQSLIPRYLGREVTPEGVAYLHANAQAGLVGARLNALADPEWSPAFVAVTGSRVVGFAAVRSVQRTSPRSRSPRIGTGAASARFWCGHWARKCTAEIPRHGS